MEENRTFLDRYAGYFAVLVVVVILYIGAKMLPAGDVFNFSVSAESQALEVAGRSEDRFLANAQDESTANPPPDLSGVPILVSNSLSPELNPYTFEGKRPDHELITYTVQRNDTPIGIAEQFGIEPETLLGGNAFLSEEASALQVGQELIILPLNGLMHEVRDGDTLEDLAIQYGVSEEDIIAYEPNRLEFPFRLYPETAIFVPGAVRDVWFWTAPQIPSRPSSSDSTGSGIAPQVQGTGTFVWPVGYRRITQHYWYGHPAVDIGLPEGNTVVASDTGTVTWAGWNVYGYGNLIVVNHGNGYETYYGHLNGINVVPGQIVYQGSPIGISGNTGRSSGSHLHFEIRYLNSMLDPLGSLR